MKYTTKFILIVLGILCCRECIGQTANHTDTYDFVRCKNIIFQDDFSGDAIGKNPSKWKWGRLWDDVVGNRNPSPRCLVYKDGNDFAFFVKTKSSTPVEPRMENDSYLTDSFTLEYDFRFLPDIQNNRLPSGITLLFPRNEDEGAPAQPDWLAAEFGVGIGGGMYSGANYGTPNDFRTFPRYPGTFVNSALHHVAVSYYKGKLSYYVDQHCVLAIPRCTFTPARFVLDLSGPICIKNVVLAASKESPVLGKLLTGKKFVTHAINFDVSKSTIKQESMGFIAQLAQFLKENPTVKLEIDGHTDSDGDAAANITLSEARANEVKKALVSFGIPENRLTTKGFGSTKPIKPNNTAEDKAENRRVEFISL